MSNDNVEQVDFVRHRKASEALDRIKEILPLAYEAERRGDEVTCLPLQYEFLELSLSILPDPKEVLPGLPPDKRKKFMEHNQAMMEDRQLLRTLLQMRAKDDPAIRALLNRFTPAREQRQ